MFELYRLCSGLLLYRRWRDLIHFVCGLLVGDLLINRSERLHGVRRRHVSVENWFFRLLELRHGHVL